MKFAALSLASVLASASAFTAVSSCLYLASPRVVGIFKTRIVFVNSLEVRMKFFFLSFQRVCL